MLLQPDRETFEGSSQFAVSVGRIEGCDLFFGRRELLRCHAVGVSDHIVLHSHQPSEQLWLIISVGVRVAKELRYLCRPDQIVVFQLLLHRNPERMDSSSILQLLICCDLPSRLALFCIICFHSRLLGLLLLSLLVPKSHINSRLGFPISNLIIINCTYTR